MAMQHGLYDLDVDLNELFRMTQDYRLLVYCVVWYKHKLFSTKILTAWKNRLKTTSDWDSNTYD